jgi:hypothetical protein
MRILETTWGPIVAAVVLAASAVGLFLWAISAWGGGF